MPGNPRGFGHIGQAISGLGKGAEQGARNLDPGLFNRKTGLLTANGQTYWNATGAVGAFSKSFTLPAGLWSFSWNWSGEFTAGGLPPETGGGGSPDTFTAYEWGYLISCDPTANPGNPYSQIGADSKLIQAYTTSLASSYPTGLGVPTVDAMPFILHGNFAMVSTGNPVVVSATQFDDPAVAGSWSGVLTISAFGVR